MKMRLEDEEVQRFLDLEAWAVKQGYRRNVIPGLKVDEEKRDIREMPAVLQPHELPPPRPENHSLPHGYISEHFRAAEFACNHCGELPPGTPPQALLDGLERTRGHFLSPIVITSGYRCKIHNAHVGGKPRSYHLRGWAADIKVVGYSALTVQNWLDDWWEGGMGSYDTFTHMDCRGYRARWEN